MAGRRYLCLFVAVIIVLYGCKPDARTSRMPRGFRVVELLGGINACMDIAFSPDGRLFFIEKNTGRVRVIKDGAVEPQPWAIFSVNSTGEGGLLAMAFDPEFEKNGYVYFFYSTGTSKNVIVRMKEVDGRGSKEEMVLEIPTPDNSLNNGGKMLFGKDGMLYVSTGDGGRADLAQDDTSLLGKILRIDPRKELPLDPADPETLIYAKGFRKGTAMAWNPLNNTLYATDKGPVGHDEINLVEEGANYGWPRELGFNKISKYKKPIWDFGRRGAGPSGMVFYPSWGNFPDEYKNNLFIVDNKIGRIYRARLTGKRLNRIQKKDFSIWLPDSFAGTILTDITVGPDGSLYIAGYSKIIKVEYSGREGGEE